MVQGNGDDILYQVSSIVLKPGHNVLTLHTLVSLEPVGCSDFLMAYFLSRLPLEHTL